MRGVCAWCGKDLELRHYPDIPGTTHGICQACFLNLRLEETLKRMQARVGPHRLFLPPDREDVILRIWREAPSGCSFIAYADRRRGERRTQHIPVPRERRTGRDRRNGNLSLLSSQARAPQSPRPSHPGNPAGQS